MLHEIKKYWEFYYYCMSKLKQTHMKYNKISRISFRTEKKEMFRVKKLHRSSDRQEKHKAHIFTFEFFQGLVTCRNVETRLIRSTLCENKYMQCISIYSYILLIHSIFTQEASLRLFCILCKHSYEWNVVSNNVCIYTTNIFS